MAPLGVVASDKKEKRKEHRRNGKKVNFVDSRKKGRASNETEIFNGFWWMKCAGKILIGGGGVGG